MLSDSALKINIAIDFAVIKQLYDSNTVKFYVSGSFQEHTITSRSIKVI